MCEAIIPMPLTTVITQPRVSLSITMFFVGDVMRATICKEEEWC
jgi:hypothetical protein